MEVIIKHLLCKCKAGDFITWHTSGKSLSQTISSNCSGIKIHVVLMSLYKSLQKTKVKCFHMQHKLAYVNRSQMSHLFLKPAQYVQLGTNYLLTCRSHPQPTSKDCKTCDPPHSNFNKPIRKC